MLSSEEPSTSAELLSEAEMAAQMKKFSAFLNGQLRPDLEVVLAQRAELVASLGDHHSLRRTVEQLQGLGRGLVGETAQVDLGCHFFAEAQCDDLGRLVVDLGLGFHADLTHAETQRFLHRKIPFLEDKVRQLTEKAENIDFHIKTVLQGMHEIQELHRQNEAKT